MDENEARAEFTELVTHAYNGKHLLLRLHPNQVHDLLWSRETPHAASGSNWAAEALNIAKALCKVAGTVCPFIEDAPAPPTK